MPEEPPVRLHETSDVSGRGAAWSGVALAASVAVFVFLIWRMDVHLDPSGPAWPHQPTVEAPQFQPPGPVLQSAAVEDLGTMRAAEDKTLKSYGWVDRKAGVIRIPLERAMELTLQRGLPATGTTMPLPGPQPNPPALQAPATTEGGTR